MRRRKRQIIHILLIKNVPESRGYFFVGKKDSEFSMCHGLERINNAMLESESLFIFVLFVFVRIFVFVQLGCGICGLRFTTNANLTISLIKNIVNRF